MQTLLQLNNWCKRWSQNTKEDVLPCSNEVVIDHWKIASLLHSSTMHRKLTRDVLYQIMLEETLTKIEFPVATFFSVSIFLCMCRASIFIKAILLEEPNTLLFWHRARIAMTIYESDKYIDARRIKKRIFNSSGSPSRLTCKDRRCTSY